jgi:hypothetical protein
MEGGGFIQLLGVGTMKGRKSCDKYLVSRVKYVKGSHICLIPNIIHDSPIWKDLMKVRQLYLRGRGSRLIVGKL